MDKAFIDLVASMRDAQKNYYALVVSKDAFMKRKEISQALGIAMRAESAVDRWMAEYREGVRQLLLEGLRQAQHEPEKKEGEA